MLAYRRTWHIKLQHMEQARELIQAAVDIAKERGMIGRAYSSHIGPADILVWEENWEHEADHNQWWAAFGNSSDVQAWFARWHAVVERGGVQEIWELQA